MVSRIVAASTGTLHNVCEFLSLYLSGLERGPLDVRLLYLVAARWEQMQCRRVSYEVGELSSQHREDMQRLMSPK